MTEIIKTRSIGRLKEITFSTTPEKTVHDCVTDLNALGYTNLKHMKYILTIMPGEFYQSSKNKIEKSETERIIYKIIGKQKYETSI